MSITEEGRDGENRARQFLEAHGFRVFQADWIALKDGVYYVVETKHQDRFLSPPYDGHGLPAYQVSARLDFEHKTGIRIIFLVLDKETKEWFTEALSKLDRGPHFDTPKAARRVYPLSSFRVFSS